VAGGGPARLLVLGQHGQRLVQHGVGALGQPGQHTLDRPAQVHRGRPGVRDPPRVASHRGLVQSTVGRAVTAGGERHAEGTGQPDHRRSADHEPADGVDDLVHRRELHDAEARRQRGLVDREDCRSVPAEGWGHHVAGHDVVNSGSVMRSRQEVS
jgi:hypothetical protein